MFISYMNVIPIRQLAERDLIPHCFFLWLEISLFSATAGGSARPPVLGQEMTISAHFVYYATTSLWRIGIVRRSISIRIDKS